MKHPALNEEQIARLESLLAPLAETSDTMRLDEVQGFFSAIASGPDSLATEDWLGDVLGQDVAFANEAEHAEAVSLLEQFYASLAESLAAGVMPDLILYSEEEGGEPDYWPWCNAYLYALDVVETAWFEKADDEGFEDLLYPIMALGGIFEEDDGDPLVSFTADEIEGFKDELPEAVQAVYGYWRAKLNTPKTVRNTDGKPGRNDPCPCGSGKKYKACHGRLS
jgi:uncharacterized protein